MSNEIATQTKPAQFDLSPQTFEQALTFAQYLAESELVPKDFKGKPGNCLVAIQWGMEIGLKPMQALQNIAVINGRPALWGDSVIALVRSSPVCEYIIETQTDDAAICKVKRRGEPEQERAFSRQDAHAAGLIGKQGPWTQYPKRMMQMRARAFALRDVFPDVLKGLPVAEEVMDTPSEPKHMGAAEVVQPAVPQSYPADKFEQNLPAWLGVIAKGRKTADQIIAMANSKHPLTEEQKAAIRKGAQPPEAPTVTADEVRTKLQGAADIDALYEAASLIEAVSDAAEQQGLNEIFEARQVELEQN